MKIIDWNAVWLSLAQLAVGTFIFCASDANHLGFTIFGGVIALIALLQTFQSFKGTTFDHDHVYFYSYLRRRRLALNEIRSANCEFGLRFSPMLLFALASGGSSGRGRKPGSAQLRSYMVNMSGEFGSAQIRFYNKRWRDAFLMALRENSPRCRITRWS